MKKVLIGFLIIIYSTHLLAQSGDQKINDLTFKEAVKLALENNVTLKTQKNEQFVNQVRRNSSIANLAPTVSARANGWQTQGNQFIEQEARVVNDTRTTNAFGTLDASMTIFNGFNKFNTIKQARAQFEAQDYLVKRTEQQVIADVANQYLTCLLDQELLKIEQETVESQRSQLTQVTEQVEAGSRAEVERINVESQLKLAEVNLLRAEIRLRNDKAILSRTLQLDPIVTFGLSEPSLDVNSVGSDLASLDVLYSIASQSRADLLSTEKLELVNRKAMSIARSAGAPDLTAFASLNSRYSDASTPSFTTQIDDNLRREYGFSIRIPIFSGLTNRLAFSRAKVNYENAKLVQQDTKNMVKAEVLAAHQNLKDASQNYQANLLSYEAAQLSYNLEAERYQLGASDFVQFTQSERDFNSARANLAQARYTLLFQDILIKFATGELDYESIIP